MFKKLLYLSIGVYSGIALLWFVLVYFFTLLQVGNIVSCESNTGTFILAISLCLAALLLLGSPLVTIGIRSRSLNLWAGIIKPHTTIVDICRVLLLGSLFNFLGVFLCLIILRTISANNGTTSLCNQSFIFISFVSLMIVFSIEMFSYCIFGPRAIMSDKAFELFNNPLQWLTAKWRRSK